MWATVDRVSKSQKQGATRHIEFVTILLLFYASFWGASMWDLSSSTRERAAFTGRQESPRKSVSNLVVV